MRNVENRLARFWTKAELNQTIKQCKDNGFTIETSPMGMTKIHDFKNEKLVLQAIPMGRMQSVILDKTYFEN